MKRKFKVLGTILGIIIGVVLFWLFPLKLITRWLRRFGKASPCPNSLAWLVNNPVRRCYLAPILDRMDIQAGERVLELGPGPGAFTVKAARRVGPDGRLIAVDIQPEMIAQVNAHVREAGLSNIETHVASAHDLPLPDDSIDRAFLVTVLPEIPDQARALAELRRVLKPDGVLSITEEFLDPDYPLPAETVQRAQAAGYTLDHRFGNWWIYTINFKNSQETREKQRIENEGAQGETRGFDHIYQNVLPAQRERLLTFRATHPYQQAPLEDTTWRYLACGQQGKAALLFLPGAFLKADMWFNQILALEDAYRILAPDAYALQGVFDMDAVCNALVRTLDAEGVERATVISISAGGGVAQYLLQKHPDRVANVVFSHCGVLEHNAETEQKTQRILRLINLLPMFIIRRVLKRMTTGDLPADSRWIDFHEAYLREAIPNVERSMYVNFLRSSLTARRSFTFEPEALDSWPGSILILSSQDDALSRQSVEQLQARYPRATTHLLESGGHHAFLFFPEAYTAALKDFLDKA
jgi:ubiquinone/menaquinone biosynthesis C-methylase UbiE/pimeloyl-ACP methyl ester carboxylesterase